MHVDCSSRHDGAPVRFCLSHRNYTVVSILDRWYGREDTYHKLLADDGNTYILRHVPAGIGEEGRWELAAFQNSDTAAEPGDQNSSFSAN